MKIIQLTAENVKKLTAVTIKPDGSLVEIAGDNGQGKTSVLDSILWAIAGKRAIQWKPIRAGETKATITLDLGDRGELALKVTRRFKDAPEHRDGYTTDLKVEDARGQPLKGPQDFLDTMVSALSLDPLEFLGADPAEKVRILKTFVPGVDFEDMERRKKEAYDARTDANRTARNEKARASGIVVPPDAPEEMIDLEPILADIGGIQEAAEAVAKERAHRQREQDRATSARERAHANHQSAAGLRRQAEDAEAAAIEQERTAEAIDSALADLPDIETPPDASALRARLTEAQEANRAHEIAGQRQRIEQAAVEAEAEAKALGDTIDAIDAEMKEAVAAAKLPARGLSFGDGMVLLNEIPFEQASDAEQLRVSLAIAMAMAPDLRVIRIRNGSLLDKKAMEVLRKVADADDFQIWLERVEASSPAAIIMEEGHVK